MKIGIMGGTFSPIHIGHLVLADEIREKCELEEIVFIPSGNPPHKEAHVSGEDRFHMTKIAIESNPYFDVLDVEIKREGYTYTVDTIKYLKQRYPEHDFYFITGADAVSSLDKWRDVPYLAANANFIGATRPGTPKKELKEKVAYLEEEYGFNIQLFEITQVDISSSEVRKRVNLGKSIHYIVPEGVERYIREKGLYIQRHPLYDEMYELAKNRLSKRRFEHSVRTAETARRFAIKYGVDYQKAELAGLLHDFSKEDSVDSMLDVIKKHHIETPECIQQNPKIAHGEVGAAVLKEEGYIDDEDILSAIRWHTYGEENMSEIAKIVYLSDAIEPGRPLYNGMEETRRDAELSIDKAILTWHNYSIVECEHPNTKLMCDKIKQTMEEV